MLGFSSAFSFFKPILYPKSFRISNQTNHIVKRCYQTYNTSSAEGAIDLNSNVVPYSGPLPKRNGTIIYQHGLFGSGSNWRSIATLVQQTIPMDAHLLDARNHGLSPHTPHINYHLMADDLYKFISQNNFGKCIVLGHSMGGRTSMTFASKFPTLVEKLVIVDVSPIQYGKKHFEQHLEIIRKLKSIDLNVITSRKEADQIASQLFPDALLKGFLLQNLVGDPMKPGKYKWRLNLDVLYSTLPNWIDEPVLRPFDGPTLFIRGGASPYIKPEYQSDIQKLYANSICKTIEGGSHYVHYERPKEFVDILTSFIDHSK